MQNANDQPFIVPEYAAVVAASFGFPVNCQSCFVDEFFWIGVMATAGLPVADEVEALRARFEVLDDEYQTRMMNEACQEAIDDEQDSYRDGYGGCRMCGTSRYYD